MRIVGLPSLYCCELKKYGKYIKYYKRINNRWKKSKSFRMFLTLNMGQDRRTSRKGKGRKYQAIWEDLSGVFSKTHKVR